MQGMHRVGEAEVRERVTEQEIAEVVGDAGRGHGIVRQERKPQSDRQGRKQRHADGGSAGECLDRRDNSLACQERQRQQNRQTQGDEIDGAESERILGGQQETKDRRRNHASEAT